jgi:hypothetical protein
MSLNLRYTANIPFNAEEFEMSEQKPKVTARWRKQPKATGLAGMGQGPRGMQLREGDKLIISVAVIQAFWDRKTGWYWYGLGKNTCDEPCATMEEAKAQADAYYKAFQKLNSAQ